MEHDGTITTWGGLIVLVLVLVFKDVIIRRLSEPRERGKAENLDAQTQLLAEMVQLQKKRGKREKKNAKKINRKLDIIGVNVVAVKSKVLETRPHQ
ncbi:MAG TPA: hypothetical protein VN516_09445 [Candidatus Baltobacteraceae bacterium]|nr:hypothetical protein [Candidatus Baltobacteraceae bacterium]